MARHRQGSDMVGGAARIGAKWQRLSRKAAPVGPRSAPVEASPPLTGRALS